MAKKKKGPPAKPRSLQSHPVISLRMHRPFLEKVDEVANHLGVNRTELIHRVMVTYLEERGEKGVEALVRKEVPDAKPIDLFA